MAHYWNETKNWTAIHRKHHAKCETEDDPHSPQILTLKSFLKVQNFIEKKAKIRKLLIIMAMEHLTIGLKNMFTAMIRLVCQQC